MEGASAALERMPRRNTLQRGGGAPLKAHHHGPDGSAVLFKQAARHTLAAKTICSAPHLHAGRAGGSPPPRRDSSTRGKSHEDYWIPTLRAKEIRPPRALTESGLGAVFGEVPT